MNATPSVPATGPQSPSPPDGHLLLRQPSQLIEQPLHVVRHATLHVMREIFLICLIGNAGALAVAVIYGWATPFANGTSAHDRIGFTVWIVLCCFVFGFVAMAPLVAHVLRSSTVSAMQATWLLLRRSWVAIAMYSGFGTTIVFFLLVAGVPVVKYNAHSTITTFVFFFGSIQLISNAVSIYRRQHLHASAATAVRPFSVNVSVNVSVTPTPKATPPRPSRWSRSLRKTVWLSLPSSISALITTQYVMIARRTRFTQPSELLLFCLGSTLLKTLLPLGSKLFIAKSRTRNARNSLFMLVAPIMHVEIQMRMAVMRAYNKSTPIYVSSAIVNVLEIVMRVVTVAVDMAFVRRARRRKDRAQQAAIDANVATGDGDAATRSVQLAARLHELETEFNKWKREHLRNCSNEILAEMAAEYCSIGVVSLCMVVLHGNRSIDLPATSAASLLELMGQQCVASATQVAFEIVTDIIAVFIELRAGIPLLDTLQHDHERFLRWVIPVVVIHACGLCLSSLIVFE